jgi:hypothetical protein
MFLEGVPGLLRGLISLGIKKGIPKDKCPFLLRVYNNEKLRKERLNALNDGELYSVLLDGSEKVIWMSTEQFQAINSMNC